jgi:hypothetical protein
MPLSNLLRASCNKKKGGLSAAPATSEINRGHSDRRDLTPYEHPVVLPHVSHFMQVPFRTSVKLPHSEHISPS